MRDETLSIVYHSSIHSVILPKVLLNVHPTSGKARTVYCTVAAFWPERRPARLPAAAVGDIGASRTLSKAVEQFTLFGQVIPKAVAAPKCFAAQRTSVGAQVAERIRTGAGSYRRSFVSVRLRTSAASDASLCPAASPLSITQGSEARYGRSTMAWSFNTSSDLVTCWQSSYLTRNGLQCVEEASPS